MPGRDVTQAFAVYEQSLGHSYFSRPYDHQYGSTSDLGDYGDYQAQQFPGQLTIRSHNGHVPWKQDERSAQTPPPQIKRHDSGLPPTPPSKRSTKPSAPSTSTSGTYTSLTGVNTAEFERSLTPDSTSSHSAEDSGHDPRRLLFKSSYTGSYQTAVEYQSTPHGDPNHSRYFSTHTSPMPQETTLVPDDSSPSIPDPATTTSQFLSPPPKSLARKSMEFGLGLSLKPKPNNYEQNDTMIYDRKRSITTHNELHIPLSLDFKPLDLDFTNRHRTPSLNASRYHNSIPNDSPRDYIPPLMQGLSLRKHNYLAEKPRPSLGNVETSTPRSSLGAPEPFKPRDHDSKRISSSSTTSAVVRAIIIDRTPPPQHRNLRHVGKNRDLRDDASLSDPSSPRFRRDTITSDKGYFAPQPHQLRQTVQAPPTAFVPVEAPSHQANSTPYPETQSQLSGLNSDFSPVSPISPINYGPTVQMGLGGDRLSIPRSSPTNNHFAIPHKSADHPSLDLTSMYRASNDRSVLRDHGLSFPRRHGRNGSSSFGGSPHPITMESTPLSFAESGLEALSVNEATAVNLYPHQNKSILVVDAPRQLNRSNPQLISPEQAPRIDPTGTHPDNFDLRWPDPAIAQPSINIDSSHLTPPKLRSDPPILAIIPPTPASEVEFDIPRTPAEKSSPPSPSSRGSSLLQRARQYSENIFNNRRSLASGNRHSLHATERRIADDNLHPFWEPRGFWDDISDGFGDEHYPPESIDDHEVLPPGGDTRDVETPISVKEARGEYRPGPSRFGSLRGFLIGNTLGIERGPTNKRRHMVRWPSSKKRRRTASESAYSVDVMPMLGMHTSNASFPRMNPVRMEMEEPRENRVPKRMASVRESARRSAGAAERERRKTRFRLRVRRPRWLFAAWRERFAGRKLRWKETGRYTNEDGRGG